MKAIHKVFYIFALLLLWLTLPAQQNNLPPLYTITSDTSAEQALAINNYQILEDKEGKWHIEDVSKPAFATAFHFNDIKQGGKKLEGIYWIRYRLKSVLSHPVNILLETNSEYNDFYLFQDSGRYTHLVTGFFAPWEIKAGLKAINAIPLFLERGKELTIYQRSKQTVFPVPLIIKFGNPEKIIKREYVDYVESRTNYFGPVQMMEMFLEGLLFLVVVYNLSFFYLTREREYIYFSLFIFFLAVARSVNTSVSYLLWNHPTQLKYVGYLNLSFAFIAFFLVQFVRTFFKTNLSHKGWDTFLVMISIVTAVTNIMIVFIDPIAFFDDPSRSPVLNFIWTILFSTICLSVLVTFLFFTKRKDRFTRLVILGGFPLMLWWGITFILLNKYFELLIKLGTSYRTIEVACILWFVLFSSFILFLRFNYLQKQNAQQALDKERLAREKETERNMLIEKQKGELERTVDERTAELKQSINELKSTQAQLIQSEKMASLGELTAGIAHEIQNPLNFVNNFSEVNKEMLEELKAERLKPKPERNEQTEVEIIEDVIANEEKINHHGKRADAIVKSMLQHSRAGGGQKELTDINALTDEYLRLAYQGQRTKDKSFNVKLVTNFDTSIGKVNIIPQDIGRVLLNLYNNAFYAAPLPPDKSGLAPKGGFKDPLYKHQPTVWVSTSQLPLSGGGGGGVLISVRDNGPGIPQKVLDKIFQPFFTTKPTGQGTGLGLSLSYDIIKAHGGEIAVETTEACPDNPAASVTEFTISIPISQSVNPGANVQTLNKK